MLFPIDPVSTHPKKFQERCGQILAKFRRK
jgi:hypothetical protein